MCNYSNNKPHYNCTTGDNGRFEQSSYCNAVLCMYSIGTLNYGLEAVAIDIIDYVTGIGNIEHSVMQKNGAS